METAAYLEEYDYNEWNFYKTRILEMKNKYCGATDESSILFARDFTSNVIKFLWKSVDINNRWNCRNPGFVSIETNLEIISFAKELGFYLSTFSVIDCGYKIGNLYTLLLPEKYKSDYGVFYTPPSLAERLLDVLAARGIDWAKHRVLDPSCGGGAFLVTVANRIIGDYRIKAITAEERIKHLETHLSGIELDGFAGWITQVLLDIIIYQDSIIAERMMKPVIITKDTIGYALINTDKFDLIVGNPPYNKVALSADLRKEYDRSLFGHANLYGLFIDAALRMKTKKGLVGFVAPTSFLGGQYFSKLRALLYKEAPLLEIDFISQRTGVFDEVLQETCLAVFGENESKDVTTNKINIENEGYSVDKIGTFIINNNDSPWIIPREIRQAKIIIPSTRQPVPTIAGKIPP